MPKPLPAKAVITDVGPGKEINLKLFLIISAVSLKPGSDIRGVPESEIKPPVRPFFIRLII